MLEVFDLIWIRPPKRSGCPQQRQSQLLKKSGQRGSVEKVKNGEVVSMNGAVTGLYYPIC